MNDKQLKRCPFCGGKADIKPIYTQKPYDLFKIQCMKCKAQVAVFLDDEDGHQKAEKMWNTRVHEDDNFDFGVSNFYWDILHRISAELADDARQIAKDCIEDGDGFIDDSVFEELDIRNYKISEETKELYERKLKAQEHTYKQMLKERELAISSYKSSATRFENLYKKEKNLIGYKKIAITTTDMTKIKNIKKCADALYETLDGKFVEMYGEDYDKNRIEQRNDK